MLTSKFDMQEVIDAGHPPAAQRVVCVDFDGTIFPFGNIMGEGPPIPGAAEAVRALHKAGYRVVIFTSRLSKAWHVHEGWDHDEACAEQYEYMHRMLDKYKIPHDAFTAEKIPAEAYFDDKAFRCAGEWELKKSVREFLGESAGL